MIVPYDTTDSDGNPDDTTFYLPFHHLWFDVSLPVILCYATYLQDFPCLPVQLHLLRSRLAVLATPLQSSVMYCGCMRRKRNASGAPLSFKSGSRWLHKNVGKHVTGDCPPKAFYVLDCSVHMSIVGDPK